MGRPVGRNLEDEMMTKIRKLFDQILDTVNKENPTYTFDFEQFVDCFDESDHFTKRVFEFLVKETAQRYRSSHPNAQHPAHPRPHTIHHYSGQDSNSGTSDANASVAVIADTSAGGTLVSSRRSNQLRFRAHNSLERDALTRSPSSTSGSPGVNEDTVSGASTSGSALRYLMSNQGFGYVGSRRGRVNQRMVLSDELLAYQPHSRDLGALPNPNLTSTRSSQSRSSTRTRAFFDSMTTAVTRGPTSSATESGTATVPHSLVSSIESRNAPRRGDTLERQHAFILRPPSRTNDLSNSMETAPESFRSDPWRSSSGSSFTSEIILPVSIDHTSTRSSSADRRRSEPSRQRQEQLLLAQDARQQQIRRLYVHNLTRGRIRQQQHGQQQQHQHQQAEQQEQTQQVRTSLRQRERTLQQHQQALRALHGQRSISSEDTHAQEQQQQEQQRYQLQDNGLMLVQPYPGSPSTPTPLLGSTPEDAHANGAVSSTASLSAHVAQMPSEERYSQFSDSTQRGRAAMRNALAAELLIEEDEQVLLTGEISRRRRRRAIRRFPSPNASPDIASDNSSAIISQLQQQQQQQDHGQDQQPCESISSSVSEAAPPQESASSTLQQETRAGEQGPLRSTNDDDSIQDTITTSTSGNTSAVVTSPPLVPTVSIELTEPSPEDITVVENSTGPTSNSISTGDNSSRTIGHLGLGLNPRTVHQTQDDGHPSHIIPPTPPSPNPNWNPMPTFQDRRRSSINPADIEAVVREMEANAWVASRRPLGSRAYSSSALPDSTLSQSRTSARGLPLSTVTDRSGNATLEPPTTERTRTDGHVIVQSLPLPSPPATESDPERTSQGPSPPLETLPRP